MWSEHKNEHEIDICKCYGTYKIKEEVKIDEEKELRLRDELNPNCRSFVNCTRLYALHTHWYACSVYMFVSLCLPCMCMTSVYSYLFDYFFGGRTLNGLWGMDGQRIFRILQNMFITFTSHFFFLVMCSWMACHITISLLIFFLSMHSIFFFVRLFCCFWRGKAQKPDDDVKSRLLNLRSGVGTNSVMILYVCSGISCVRRRTGVMKGSHWCLFGIILCSVQSMGKTFN